jgi:hypothetical protein
MARIFGAALRRDRRGGRFGADRVSVQSKVSAPPDRRIAACAAITAGGEPFVKALRNCGLAYQAQRDSARAPADVAQARSGRTPPRRSPYKHMILR